ncbi:MAG: hypothetical protein AN484_27865, partial [Aphanizomenon flos-aquae WA102]
GGVVAGGGCVVVGDVACVGSVLCWLSCVLWLCGRDAAPGSLAPCPARPPSRAVVLGFSPRSGLPPAPNYVPPPPPPPPPKKPVKPLFLPLTWKTPCDSTRLTGFPGAPQWAALGVPKFTGAAENAVLLTELTLHSPILQAPM